MAPKFADLPIFQVVNDVGSSVRWISGQMVTLEFGPHAKRIERLPDWQNRVSQSISFQLRFDELHDNLDLALALDRDLDAFKADFLLPLLADLEAPVKAEAV